VAIIRHHQVKLMGTEASRRIKAFLIHIMASLAEAFGHMLAVADYRT
jgi:hypothetical protein